APVNTARPQISGPAIDGALVTVDPGVWSGTSPIAFAYQWQRCNDAGTGCTPIAGATGQSYTIQSADAGSGKGLVVAVTATNSAGSATAQSFTFSPIAAAPPANTALPTISGPAVQDQALTASTGTWSGTPPFTRSEEHTSELQSRENLVCRL